MPLEESQPAGKHIFHEGLSAACRHRRGGSTGSPPAPPCREPLFKNRAQDPAADLSCPQPRVYHVPPSLWARSGIAPCLSVRALGESGRSEELRQQCHGWELLVSCGHGSGMN